MIFLFPLVPLLQAIGMRCRYRMSRFPCLLDSRFEDPRRTMESITLLLSSLGGRARTMVAIMSLIPLLVFLMACIPGLVFSSFRRDGLERCAALAGRFQEWTAMILKGSSGTR